MTIGSHEFPLLLFLGSSCATWLGGIIYTAVAVYGISLPSVD